MMAQTREPGKGVAVKRHLPPGGEILYTSALYWEPVSKFGPLCGKPDSR
jgi:hypothetical protein